MNPFHLIQLSETASTNTYLKELTSDHLPAEFTTVITDFQSNGRGQKGNHWEADRGKNLLMSCLVYPRFLAHERQFLLSEITALSLCETFSTYAEGFTIKWPNDIYWKDAKIAGTLIENEWVGQELRLTIIGNGINLNQEQFHSDAPNPVSLLQIIGKETSREEFLHQWMERFMNRYEQLKSHQWERIRNAYHQRLYRREGLFGFRDKEGISRASIHSVGDDGRLHLLDEKGQKRSYWFKEVAYVH